MGKKIYRMRAKSMDEQGRGVAEFNHSMIPIPGLLPKELAEVELYRKGTETLGRIVSIVEKSPDREDDVCPYSSVCGGCQLWHMKYPAQLKFKRQQVESLMGKYAKVPEVIGMSKPENYRHKVHATLGRDEKGHIISGIYQEKSHRLLDVKRCRIQDETADEIMAVIRDGMKKLGIPPYDEDKRRGLLRHVLIRTGWHTGDIMVVFVLSSLKFDKGKTLSTMLLKKFPQIKTIVYNLNPGKTSMVLGREEKVVYGSGYIEDVLCDMTFQISPQSFYQVNPCQTEILYKKAMEMACITKEDTVLDTYCGTGTITLIASQYAKSVTGVELNPAAVLDARDNARKNHRENVHFIHEDATKYMEQRSLKESFDVIIMDPPRSGSTQDFLKAAARMKPDRIVYISCNPKTQARDMKVLMSSGYKVAGIQPVDMFPMTVGIENIVLFRRG